MLDMSISCLMDVWGGFLTSRLSWWLNFLNVELGKFSIYQSITFSFPGKAYAKTLAASYIWSEVSIVRLCFYNEGWTPEWVVGRVQSSLCDVWSGVGAIWVWFVCHLCCLRMLSVFLLQSVILGYMYVLN